MSVERARLWSAIGSAICLILFTCLASGVSYRAGLLFDNFVRAGVHYAASPSLTGLAMAFSFLGSVWVLSLLVVIALLWLWMLERRKPAIALAAAMAGAIVLNNVLKYAFHRVRPEPFFGIAPDSFSFPSGHGLFSSCFYGSLSFILAANFKTGMSRAAIWAGTALLVSAIGWSRIYLGVHYPTDVIGSLLIAISWICALQSVGLLMTPSDCAG